MCVEERKGGRDGDIDGVGYILVQGESFIFKVSLEKPQPALSSSHHCLLPDSSHFFQFSRKVELLFFGSSRILVGNIKIMIAHFLYGTFPLTKHFSITKLLPMC